MQFEIEINQINRKDNLRKCKKSENQQNKAKSKNRIYTSKYKGVDFRNGQWRCKISYENIRTTKIQPLMQNYMLKYFIKNLLV